MGDEDLIYKHALINAVKHGGKADFKIVISKIVAENPEVRKKIRELIPQVRKIVAEVNSMDLETQRKILEEKYSILLETEKKGREEKKLPPLPGVEKGVLVKTRFAPNPDFMIHLGNARPAILSYEYAKMYNGKMILRFEDTDPRIKTPLPEAYEAIRSDLRWLGIKWDEEYIQSLRMPLYYDIAKKLIEKGGAYVDTLKKEEFAGLLERGVEHPNRNSSPEKNLELFDRMLEGSFGEGEAVLRVKTEWGYKDKSIVDWVAFRIIDSDKHPHPIVGSRYIVWPTYNFAAAVDDYLMGVTHVIRGKEHKQNTVKQSFLYRHLGWKQPYTIHLGRLRLEGFIMSKSFIKKLLIESGEKYFGPDDPRFGTISGLRKRGIVPEAIRNTIMHVGAKKTDASISYTNLASENKSIIDKKSPRIMFVDNPVIMEVSVPECIDATIPYHPDNHILGERSYTVCDDEEIAVSYQDYKTIVQKEGMVRLLGLGNFSYRDSRLVLVSKNVEEARKEKAKIIQWTIAKKSMKAVLLKPEGEELIPEGGWIEDLPIIDKYIGKNIQLVRKGFAVPYQVHPYVLMYFSHS